ncbi:MAG TPA: GNAT family N-acetyltransferase [Panacibacter sp.]|nr:GNAT family N-acetyltransferase [Panacibacter sp.]HNP46573.1 GNAT family N-acetyltransferase [Panacibacter sp.]
MYQTSQSLAQDLPELAACQVACFPGSFATKLGNAYVAQSLGWFIGTDNRFLFHIKAGSRIVGYCGGFIPQFAGDGSTSGMMRFAMKEAFTGMLKRPWLFFSKEIRPYYPLILKNVYRKISGSSSANTVSPDTSRPVEKRCGLVVIGVHPDYRGTGCFDILMLEFERQAMERGIQQLTLSVKPTNGRAIAAYKKCGWMINREDDKAVEMWKEV